MTQRKHPVFSGFSAVVWLAIAVVSVNAANPSFNALVWTNSGGVITPIKSPTNVVRITSGLADNATNVALVVDTANFWTGDAALLSLGNGGTNRFLFGSDGSLSLLPQVGPSLTKLRMISEGGFIRSGMILPSIISGIEVDSHNNLFIGAQAGWSDDRSAVADAYVIGTSAATALIDADDVIAMDYYALNVATNAWYVQAIGNNALDGALGVTNVVAIGSNAGGNSLVYGRNHVIIGPNTLVDTELQEVTVVGANAQANGDNAIALGANAVANGLGDVSIGDSSNLFRVNTSASDGNPAYRLDTSITHTSGNLAEIANNGTNKFTLDYAGNIVAQTFFADQDSFDFWGDDPTAVVVAAGNASERGISLRSQHNGSNYSVLNLATSTNGSTLTLQTLGGGNSDFISLSTGRNGASSSINFKPSGVNTFTVDEAGRIQTGVTLDGAGSYSRLAIDYRTDTNQIVFDSQSSGTGTNYPIVFANRGTPSLKIATNAVWPNNANQFFNGAGGWSTPAGSGDVTGPASSTDNDISVFNGSTGKIIKRSTSAATFGDASSATFTNDWNLSGATDPRLTAANSSLTSSVRLTADGLTSGNSIIMNNTGWFIQTYGTFVMGNPIDVIIVREAAGTLALRNGTNPQTNRIYRTFTDASNYDRLALNTASGTFTIAAETAGTGTDNINLNLSPAGTGAIQVRGSGDISSGTWTPTLTSVANLTSTTSFQCQYQRVGNVVTFSGKLSADPSLAATSTQIGISLPIASDFSAEENAGGTAFAPAIAGQGAAIKADATNDRLQMQWISGDITDQPMFFSGSYLVQ